MYYNRSIINTKAHMLKHKYRISWGEALHRAWNGAKVEPINSERIQMAKRAAGIPGEVFTFTWKQWHDIGYEVIHGSKARFQVELHYPSKGDGETYVASFFDGTQVQPILQ